MATTTPNIGLTLPVGTEKVSRQIINQNMSKIDEKVGAVPAGQNLQSQVTSLSDQIASVRDIYTGQTDANAMHDNAEANTAYVGKLAAGASNSPNTSYAYYIYGYKISDGYGKQIAYRADDTAMLTRTKYNGVWGSWQELALNSNLVKYKEVTDTTSSTGALYVQQSNIIGALVVSDNHTHMLALPRADGYVKVLDATDMSVIANTQVKVRAFYISI